MSDLNLDYDDDTNPLGPIHWRIGVLDSDGLNDPQAITDNAATIASWYVHDAAMLLGQLQRYRTFEQAIRDALWHCYNAPENTQDDTIQEVIDAMATLDRAAYRAALGQVERDREPQ